MRTVKNGKGYNLKNKRPNKKPHLIEEMRWFGDYIACKCGWSGKISEYSVHVKA
jgi:hypothetical protein